MFGSNLLVALVFNEEERVTFYVPHNDDDDAQGKWRSWFDYSKIYKSGRWYTEPHGFDTLPLLIRPESIIVVNSRLEKLEDDALNGLELLVNGSIVGQRNIEIVDPSKTHEVLKIIQITSAPEALDKIKLDEAGIIKFFLLTLGRLD